RDRECRRRGGARAIRSASCPVHRYAHRYAVDRWTRFRGESWGGSFTVRGCRTDRSKTPNTVAAGTAAAIATTIIAATIIAATAPTHVAHVAHGGICGCRGGRIWLHSSTRFHDDLR